MRPKALSGFKPTPSCPYYLYIVLLDFIIYLSCKMEFILGRGTR